MIELTSPAEIIALKLEWEKRNGQRSTTPQAYKGKTSRGGQRYYVRGPGEYTDERKSALQLIAENYKKTEEKRRAKRGLSSGERMTQKARERKENEREENERWNKIYEERIEDKSYYGDINVTYARNWDV